MTTLPLLLKAGSAAVMALGTGNLLLGVNMLEGLGGSQFPINTPIGPLSDSQYRFSGGLEAGWGALVWWASDDLSTRQVPLAILGVAMAVSGLGRALSAMKHGWGTAKIPVPVLMGVEVGVPLAVWWFGGF